MTISAAAAQADPALEPDYIKDNVTNKAERTPGDEKSWYHPRTSAGCLHISHRLGHLLPITGS